MQKTRIMVAIATVIGMVGTFMPWARMGVITIDGSVGDGWITLAFFGVALLVALIGQRDKLLRGGGAVTVCLLGLVNAGIGISKLTSFSGLREDLGDAGLFGSLLQAVTKPGEGLYVIIAAGLVCTALAVYSFNAAKSEANSLQVEELAVAPSNN